MRVLIVEPDLSGHHAPYLRHLLQSLAELQQEATVLTYNNSAESPQFGLHLRDVAAGVTWDDCLPSSSKAPRRVGFLFSELLKAVERHSADHVWVPYADFFSLYLGARVLVGRKARWPKDVWLEGLQFRGTFAYPAPNWRKVPSKLRSRLLLHRANWDVLHFLDPLVYEEICRRHPKMAGRFRVMPDPVEPVEPMQPELARGRLGIPPEGRYLSYLGLMADRDNVVRLFSAFEQANLPPDCKLLLAGPTTNEVQHCLEHDFGRTLRGGRVVQINRHLSLEEVKLGVLGSNVVCIPAKHRVGSSSFLIRAATAGRPVLADDFGWTGWAIETFQLGWKVDVTNIGAFARSMVEAMEQAPTIAGSPRAERFVQFHSAANFQSHWGAGIRKRLGLTADPCYRPWQWVLEGC